MIAHRDEPRDDLPWYWPFAAARAISKMLLEPPGPVTQHVFVCRDSQPRHDTDREAGQ